MPGMADKLPNLSAASSLEREAPVRCATCATMLVRRRPTTTRTRQSGTVLATVVLCVGCGSRTVLGA
jgi:RNase P subunit RPR2